MKFDVPFYEGSGTDKLYDDKKHDEIFYREFPVRDNVTYNDKIEDSGYLISLSGLGYNTIMPVKPKFKFYSFNPVFFSNCLYSV